MNHCMHMTALISSVLGVKNQAIQRVLDNCGTIDQDKDYEVIIRPKKEDEKFGR